MFTYLKSIKKWTPEIITIEDLVNLIKEPKQITDYSYYKQNSAVSYKPHGTFKELGKKGLKDYSGYLFFDIDKIEDIDLVKQKLINFGANLIYKSLSGTGIHFLLKLNKSILNQKDFDTQYDYYFNELNKVGFNIDANAKGLSRSAIIGYDKEVIYTGKEVNNIMVSFANVLEKKEIHTIPNDTIDNGLKGATYIEKQKEIHTLPNDTINRTIFRTKIQIDNNEDYIIKEIDDYINIFVSNNIKDGLKHKIYKKAIIEIMTLNENIQLKDIENWMIMVNNKQKIKMENLKLKNLVKNTYEWVVLNDIKAKGRKKIVHFNRNSNLSPQEKQNIARKEIGKIRTDKTFNRIKEFMMDNNYEPTQKETSIALDLGIATIKRYWKKVKAEQNKKQDQVKVEKIKYRNFQEVEISYTNEDKKLFLDYVEFCKINFGGVSEILLQRVCALDKEITWYFFQKWVARNDIYTLTD